MSRSAELMHVLLVEDSLPDVELTLEALSEAKVANDVAVARDCEQALARLRQQGEHADAPLPDLVILDLNLPKVDGHEVLAAMRDDPRLRRIAVAVLTTSSAERDVVASYELGANCYLTKPVDADQFLSVVQAVDEFWLGLVRLPARTGATT